MIVVMPGRAPHGARGLKQREEINIDYDLMSRPARGAWIETTWQSAPCAVKESRPARGAWIETAHRTRRHRWQDVAPHTGRVD